MRRAAFLLLALTGCAYRPAGEPLAVDMPATLAPKSTAAVWPDATWWRGFDCPELDALITEASTRNQDLAAAAARIHQAAALARVAGAPLLPSVAIGADIVGQNSNSSTGAVSGLFEDATLTASYEIDFWGRVSANAAAAQASLRASRYDREILALTVTTAVAGNYFNVLAARERRTIALENLANARAVLLQVEARARAGTALARDVAQQRALTATQEATIPPLAQKEDEALAALATLLGRPPQGFTVPGYGLDPVAMPIVAPGLPSTLLIRRPDIASAEARLAAADADVAAARAAMLPRIDLTGAAGLQSAALSGATGGTSFLYTLAAGLTQPIFDNGALAGQRDEAIARQEELIARYRAAVLAAFADVQKALQAIAHLRDQQTARETAVTESRRAFDLATVQYRAGAEDLLTMLDAQRALYAAQDQFSRIKLARIQALVALYKALGGGWQQGGSS